MSSPSPRTRNTPAYAGKTSGGVTSGYRFQKHPRLRGEDEHFDTPRAPLQETPPLTRGRRQGGESLREALGNTPAYAGKTGRGVTLPLQAGKHPRLRGEDSVPRRVSEAGPETPPLTRGRQENPDDSTDYLGNTPAYAGKTTVLFEYAIDVAETPPLTRGRPNLHRIGGVVHRNTPAYAGKTRAGTKQPIGLGKHPRLRGEDTKATLAAASPVGNTPAYAGKTP